MDKERVLEALVNAGVVRFGEFTLVSGETSPIYVDLRVLPSYPREFEVVVNALSEIVKELNPDVVCGIETAGIPLATAIGIKLKKKIAYVRKKVKNYGTGSRVEGEIREGERVVLVDDLLTRGTSKVDFATALQEEGVEVQDVVVVLDREQGGEEVLVKKGMKLHKLATLRDLLSYMVDKKAISSEQYSEMLVYLGEGR